MKREYVPIKVYTKKRIDIWHIDVTNLSSEELYKLKEELSGKSDIYCIDKIIASRFCTNAYYNRNARDNKRDNIKMIKKRMKHR